MSDVAIRVENLGKRYQLGQSQRYRALRDTLGDVLSAPKRWFTGRRNAPTAGDGTDFWALKDVSFEIKPGEVVGIIGRNGAGKSTLLKILSRITEPTEGGVDLYGRVGSLLEVGTGFHPELTGRENIYLNGAILGMKRAEIVRKFDEIVAFAEVEKFLDTPVKFYSSGMYMRLAFAVAAHLEPEILLVDEVLAVGDAGFQKKCLGKMGEVAKQGRTVLFVSHNMAVIKSLCQTVIRLHAGRIAGQGRVDEQILEYQAEFQPPTAGEVRRELGPDLFLEQMTVGPSAIESGEAVTITVAVRATTATVVSGLCILIHTAADVRVAIIDLRRADGPYRVAADQGLTVTVTVPSLAAVEGEYALGLYVESAQTSVNATDVCRLEVLPRPLRGGVVPYKVFHRGYLELPHRVDDVRIG